MPNFEPSIVQTKSQESPFFGTGVTIVPPPFFLPLEMLPLNALGEPIPDDQVCRVWKIQANNGTGAIRTLFIWSGDDIDGMRRILFVLTIPPATPAWTFIEVPQRANPVKPIITLRPQSQFAPTRENKIFAAHDDPNVLSVRMKMWYYYQRG